MPDLELGQKLSDSAREYANLAISSLKVSGVVDPPTVIAACARMAGTYLFRSFDLKLPNVQPGQAVLSVEADQHAPMLVRTAAGILTTLGIALPSSPPATAYNSRTTPIQSFLETQQLLEPLFSPIQSSTRLVCGTLHRPLQLQRRCWYTTSPRTLNRALPLPLRLWDS